MDYGYSWFTKDSSSSIFRTTFPGGPWAIEYSAPSGFYNHFTGMRTGSTCIAVRSNGGITQCNYYISALNQIGSNIPQVYSLSQNYPNPFNPPTKIKFAISGSSVAQTFLSVYDILGREVAILVNEILQPGTYEVDWDASAQSSGVYYYRLESGSYAETKKMVLVK